MTYTVFVNLSRILKICLGFPRWLCCITAHHYFPLSSQMWNGSIYIQGQNEFYRLKVIYRLKKEEIRHYIWRMEKWLENVRRISRTAEYKVPDLSQCLHLNRIWLNSQHNSVTSHDDDDRLLRYLPVCVL